MWIECKGRGVLHYFDLFLVFCNLGTRTIFLFWELEEKDTRCIYVTKTAPNNLVLFFSYPLVCLACCIESPINVPIPPGVQANENTAANIFQISKL